jgi:hypothetical protein
MNKLNVFYLWQYCSSRLAAVNPNKVNLKVRLLSKNQQVPKPIPSLHLILTNPAKCLRVSPTILQVKAVWGNAKFEKMAVIRF